MDLRLLWHDPQSSLSGGDEGGRAVGEIQHFQESFKPISTSGDVSVSGNSVTLSSDNGLSFVDMGELPQTMLLTCSFTVDSSFTQAGFCFGTNGVNEDSLYIMINAKNYCVEYDGRTLSDIDPHSERMGSKTTYRFEPSVEYSLKLAVEDDIIAFYINGEKTTINRIYAAPGKDFGIFASNSGITFNDIQISVTDNVTATAGVPAAADAVPPQLTQQKESSNAPVDETGSQDPTESENPVADSVRTNNGFILFTLVITACAAVMAGIIAFLRRKKKVSK